MNGGAPFDELRNSHGERLDATWHPGSLRDVVVLAHGLTSTKDRPWLTALAEAIAAAGFAALRFSFAGNGGSEGRFEDATLTKEVEDLGSVIDALTAAGFERISCAGHSMGAAVGVLRAARDAASVHWSRWPGWCTSSDSCRRTSAGWCQNAIYCWASPAAPGRARSEVTRHASVL